ncbi:DUF3179 domain-containing protein [Rubrivirga sp. IMCC43871]|uniref:DUF3179 domain-containing protein n=1 Tax=Rubrivirga sp. IMCC43871 TaxID=3391575 RepID=UPI00398FCA32
MRSTFLLAAVLMFAGCSQAQAPERALPGFDTNTARRTIELSELQAGGPPKDGIPAIDAPDFVDADRASVWLAAREPVILLRLNGDAKIYPLQILTWHEIANDEVGGEPVAVTFCPLCYSAVAVRRTVETPDGPRVLDFGVSGLLRHSDLVMFDRQTETLWQQYTGEALVGDLVGSTLDVLPAQIVSFAQARAAEPDAPVLSRTTGHEREYGRNPYVGYDDIAQSPILYDGPPDGRLAPMARVVAVEAGGAFRAYPADVTRERGVVEDRLGGVEIVVFHTGDTATALGEDRIASARTVGSAGAFRRTVSVDGRPTALTFRVDGGAFVDAETGSRWDATGTAIDGPLAGTRLALLPTHDTFAFAWFAFRPETTVWE